MLILLLSGCSSVKQVAGIYSSKKSPVTFILNEDSTYEYRYKMGFDYEYSTGQWWLKQEGNQLVLNSDFESKLLPLDIEEVSSGLNNRNFLSVFIDMPEKEMENYYCFLYINDELHKSIKCKPVDSISIDAEIDNFFWGISADVMIPSRYLDTLYTEKFFPKYSKGNYLKVDIKYVDSLFNYRVFDNEKVRLSQKGISFRYSKSGKKKYLKRKSL